MQVMLSICSSRFYRLSCCCCCLRPSHSSHQRNYSKVILIICVQCFSCGELSQLGPHLQRMHRMFRLPLFACLFLRVCRSLEKFCRQRCHHLLGKLRYCDERLSSPLLYQLPEVVTKARKYLRRFGLATISPCCFYECF